jgi:hypothetical protein
VFPFTYNGQTYFDCTPVDNNDVPWCATTSNFVVDGQWGNCRQVSVQGSQGSVTPPPGGDYTAIAKCGVCPLWKQLFDKLSSNPARNITDAELALVCNELAANNYMNPCADLVKVNKDCHGWASECKPLPIEFSCKYPPPDLTTPTHEAPTTQTHEISTGVFRRGFGRL